MSFFQGLITGAATSIDTQLKKDMERTQERAEGMAQYRVTRRRAEIERQDKEKREVSDVLNKLAGLVGGDVDKAAQLYISGGKSVAGGTALYDELKKNADAGKDISTAITFAEPRAKPGQLTEYVSQFITPITALPAMEGEMKGSGLYGAMFKPDLAKTVMQQVEEEAPLPASEKFLEGDGPSAAKIDRTGFLAAEEYKETVAQRERGAAKEQREVTAFTSAEARYKSIEQRAEDAAKIAKTAAATTEQIQQANLLAKKAEAAQRVVDETRKAAEFVSQQKLTGLSIEEKEIALQKEKDHPEFATFEKMAVYASTKLNTPGLTTDQKNTFEQMYDDAIAGALAYESATDSTAPKAAFSTPSLDSIIDNAIERQLKPIGLVAGVDQKIEDLIEGNESKYFDNMSIALGKITKRLTPADGNMPAEAQRAIAAEKEALSNRIQGYSDNIANAYATADGTKRNPKPDNFKDVATFSQMVKQYAQQTNTALSSDTIGKLSREVGKNNLKPGDVVETPTGYRVWTGTRFIE